MSDRRPPKRVPIVFHQQDDGSWILTAYAPRDGANRQTSAYDLHYRLTSTEFYSLVDSLVMARAGTK